MKGKERYTKSEKSKEVEMRNGKHLTHMYIHANVHRKIEGIVAQVISIPYFTIIFPCFSIAFLGTIQYYFNLASEILSTFSPSG